MDDDGFLLSKSFVEKLKLIIRRVLGEQSPTRGRERRVYEPAAEWQGQITSTVSAPTNGWTGAVTCTFQPYELDPTDTSTPQKMIASTTHGPFTVVIRDKTLSVSAGSYARVKRIDGDWTFTWTGC